MNNRSARGKRTYKGKYLVGLIMRLPFSLIKYGPQFEFRRRLIFILSSSKSWFIITLEDEKGYLNSVKAYAT